MGHFCKYKNTKRIYEININLSGLKISKPNHKILHQYIKNVDICYVTHGLLFSLLFSFRIKNIKQNVADL